MTPEELGKFKLPSMSAKMDFENGRDTTLTERPQSAVPESKPN